MAEFRPKGSSIASGGMFRPGKIPEAGGGVGFGTGSKVISSGIPKPEAPFGVKGPRHTPRGHTSSSLQGKANREFFRQQETKPSMTRENFNQRFNALEGNVSASRRGKK